MKATRYSGSLDSRIPQIARRIRSSMQRAGMSEVDLANDCNRLAQSRFADESPPCCSRERIAKILMNCHTQPKKSAARVLTYKELQMIAAALNVSLEWIVGQEHNHDPVIWNALADPKRAEHILQLLAEHEEQTGEIAVWAEYLMCSLVSPSFMHAYHEARFAGLNKVGLGEEKRRLVELFDRMGNARRNRLLNGKRERAYTYTQVIFLSELEKIAQGRGAYKRISKSLRAACLKNLSELVAERALKINLVVVRDESAEHIKAALRDYDSLSVFGDKFTLWADHWGSIGWSEHASYIRKHRKFMNELQERAICRDHKETPHLLSELTTQIR